ncbi:MAG: ketopantoate reductase family protein [Deltaproteobacteria bacterium]|nr:ketopantoate reductase family protein [Deltaproteobacteria bacterium]
MRYIIYGAGAIGGVIGARLFRAGKEVILIARGPHLEAIHEHGLKLETPEWTETFRIPAVSGPAEIRFQEGDAVILGMKSQDTEAAVTALRAAAGDVLPVVCTQNGVVNERTALRRFENVYAMLVILPAMHMAPGVVEQNFAPVPGILDTGRYPAGIDSTTEMICADLRDGGFSALADAAVMRQKYAKLLMNLTNAFQVICGNEADGREILRAARQEAIACYQAAGIDYATDEEVRNRRGNLITIKPIGEGRTRGSSSWQSAMRRTGSIEADWLNGEICLLGRLHGVPTPVNRLLQTTANRIAREKLPPGSMSSEELLRLMKQ